MAARAGEQPEALLAITHAIVNLIEAVSVIESFGCGLKLHAMLLEIRLGLRVVPFKLMLYHIRATRRKTWALKIVLRANLNRKVTQSFTLNSHEISLSDHGSTFAPKS